MYAYVWYSKGRQEATPFILDIGKIAQRTYNDAPRKFITSSRGCGFVSFYRGKVSRDFRADELRYERARVSSFLRLLLEDLVSGFGRESIDRREFLRAPLESFRCEAAAAAKAERGQLFPPLVFANA